MLAQILVAHLGPEFVGVKHVRNSPLFVTSDDGGPPLVDRTKSNLFLKGFYSEILRHMKWALALKGPSFHFQIITDERIKNVFVGAEAYRARPKDDRDDGAAYNSLPDLVNSPQLLIIRLGQLGYKNVAAAGALKEALLIRAAGGLPTWLIESEEQAWTFSKDGDVSYYVDNNFEVMSFEGTGTRPAVAQTDWDKMRQANSTFTEEELGMSLDTQLTPPSEAGDLIPTPPSRPRPRPAPVVSNSYEIVAPGENSPKKGWRR